jgi:hypothetical protein
MSYTTLEVEIDHGKVTPKEPDKLPESGRGLLTILPGGGTVEAGSFLETLDALQRHLQLDEKKAQEWMNAIRDARR